MDTSIIPEGSSEFKVLRVKLYEEKNIDNYQPSEIIVLLANSVYKEEKRSNEKGYIVPKSYIPHINRWLSSHAELKISNLTQLIFSSFCTEILSCSNALVEDGFSLDCMNPANILQNFHYELAKDKSKNNKVGLITKIKSKLH